MEKKVDAMKMVRRIRDSHHEKLKDRPTEERLAFFREKSRALCREANASEKDQGLADFPLSTGR
ncbi:hypothetical protein [Salinibacter ruber]|uniref:hypothetical protein n=1 Tax=Salinibacter ruber TaxID=146919 RepID=UPI000E6D0519|nr:hypothetical protein [Salinibacter ruber]